jgi:hypothetical protein
MPGESAIHVSDDDDHAASAGAHLTGVNMPVGIPYTAQS